MKKTLLLLAFLCSFSLSTMAQKTRFVDATELGIHGYTKQTDKSPYYRFDHTGYAFNKSIVGSSKHSSGLYIVFKTNSSKIVATWENTPRRLTDNMNGILQLGLDLYVKTDGKWKFSAVGRASTVPEKNRRTKVLLKNLSNEEREYLLYLPGWCELRALKIGVDPNATIEGLPTPFRHKVIVHGSSITHGASASRSGMTYTALMSRNLGINFVNFGFSGNCKLQPEFLEFLKTCEADAFVFDAFSNSTPKQMEERLHNFVDGLVKAHPGKPLIFLQTPIPNRPHYNKTATRLMKEIKKRYKDVYFLDVPNVVGDNGTVDMVHPNDLGFDRFVKAYQPKIAKILKKYGIK